MYAKFAIFELFRVAVGGRSAAVGNTLILKPASYAELGKTKAKISLNLTEHGKIANCQCKVFRNPSFVVFNISV